MTRSLPLRLYLYTLAALLLMGALTFGAARMLVDAARRAERQAAERTAAEQLLPPPERDRVARARAIGWAVEAAWAGPGPDPERLVAVAHAFHVSLAYVPGRLPSERPDPEAGPPPVWVRLSHRGHQRGWLRVAPDGPRPHPLVPLPAWPWLALAWVGLWGLVLLPPVQGWIVRPLRHMAAAARRLGAGDLSTPVAVTRADEFGELERAFEDMRLRLLGLLAEKEQLLGDVSHELRAPLGRMALVARLLEPETEAQELLADLREEIALMEGLIQEIMLLARARAASTLETAHVDLAALARQAVERRARLAAAHGARFELHLAPAAVDGAAELLERALGNLLDNALRHGKPGGTITVTTGVAAGGPFVEVADEGPGVAPEHLTRVFEPFFRPDASRSRDTGGSGLGLAIVQAIARRHGGEATMASDPGRGARVRIAFPGVGVKL